MNDVLDSPLRPRTLEQALTAGPRLLARAATTGDIQFGASFVKGPAVLIGLHQRATRVLDLSAAKHASVRILRRATSGTAAYIGGHALIFTLALPRVTSLFPDASPRTLLNRNVRPFLRGLTKAGGISHYFGRDWLSVKKRPALLLGFDATPEGAVLIEAIAGWDHPFSLPEPLKASYEHRLDRYRTGPLSSEPAALSEVLPAARTPEEVALSVASAISAQAETPVALDTEVDVDGGAPPAGPLFGEMEAIEPVLGDASWIEPVRIPIGWLEMAWLPPAEGEGKRTLWLGGDVLCPRYGLDWLAARAVEWGARQGTSEEGRDLIGLDAPLEGVSVRDLFGAAVGAVSGSPRTG
ncbi:MAG: hypothetical protein R3F14_38375 [Polyangiaceae bacterium]